VLLLEDVLLLLLLFEPELATVLDNACDVDVDNNDLPGDGVLCEPMAARMPNAATGFEATVPNAGVGLGGGGFGAALTTVGLLGVCGAFESADGLEVVTRADGMGDLWLAEELFLRRLGLLGSSRSGESTFLRFLLAACECNASVDACLRVALRLVDGST
jgi:hypothetical protein